MHIIIGAANFSQNYGLDKSKISSISMAQKILNFCEKNKIKTIDDAYQYNNSKKIYKKLRLNNFNLITKIKLPRNYKSYKDLNNYFKNIISKDLKNLSKKNFSHILAHEVYKDDKKNKIIIKILKHLKKRKFTKKIGVSGYNPNEIKKILKIWKPDVIQLPLNVLDQRLISSKIIDLLHRKKIEIHVRSIFLQGMLVRTKIPKKLRKFKKYFINWNKWCSHHKINKVKACIQYVRRFKKISAIIIGINSLSQIKQINRFFNERNINLNYINFGVNNNLIDPRKWN